MSNPLPDDEEPVIRKDGSKRESPLFQRTLSATELDTSDEPLTTRSRVSAITIFSLVGACLLLLLVTVAIWIYFEQKRPSPVLLAEPKQSSKPALLSTPAIAPTRPPVPEAISAQIKPDMFHVTSIALGATPLAIVNGKRVEEGDWLPLTVANNGIAVHVVQIEDGVVHFACGKHVIDAHLSPAISKAPKKP